MAFRFRRSIKILPGLRINTSLKGVSASVGGKGFRYTVGTSGKRVTAGIPGTGLSYSVQSGRKKKAKPADEGGEGAGAALLLAPAVQSQANWYLHINGEARGPMTADALRAALAQGALLPQDWIWREGLADWIQVRDEWTVTAPSGAIQATSSPSARDDRWSVGRAFWIMLAISAAVAAINHKGVVSDWAMLSFPDFLASMCRRLLTLPMIVAAFAVARNFIVCR